MRTGRSVAFIGIYFIALPAAAMSLIDRPVEEVHRDSVVALRGTVVALSGKCNARDACFGYMVDIVVDESLSASVVARGRRRVSFCAPFPLNVREEYYLFLDAARPAQVEQGCDLALPKDGAFQKKHETYFRVNSPESRHWISFEGRDYESSAVAEPDFELDLQRIRHAIKN